MSTAQYRLNHACAVPGLADASPGQSLAEAMACSRKLRSAIEDKVRRLDRTTDIGRFGTLAGGLIAVAGALGNAHRDVILGGTALGLAGYQAGNLYAPQSMSALYQRGLDAVQCVDSLLVPAAGDVSLIRARASVLRDALDRLNASSRTSAAHRSSQLPGDRAGGGATVGESPAQGGAAAGTSAVASGMAEGASATTSATGSAVTPTIPDGARLGGGRDARSATDGGGGGGGQPSSTVSAADVRTRAGRALGAASALTVQDALAFRAIDALNQIARAVDRQAGDYLPTLDQFLNFGQSLLSSATARAGQILSSTTSLPPRQTEELSGANRTAEDPSLLGEVAAATELLDQAILQFGSSALLGSNALGCTTRSTTVATKPPLLDPGRTEVELPAGTIYELTVLEGQRPFQGAFRGAQPPADQLTASQVDTATFRFEAKAKASPSSYRFVIRDAEQREVVLTLRTVSQPKQ